MQREYLLRMSVFSLLVTGMLLPIIVLARSKHASEVAGGKLEAVWGRQGSAPGLFQKPRAMTIDDRGRLFIIDKAARIQVFSQEGIFSHGWQTPAWEYGKPTGLSFDNDGNLMVADTHYYRVLFYTPQGKLLEEKTLGGEEGYTPGKFGWVTDAVQDSQGNYYVSEYGELDRIQKFSSAGKFLFGWGGHGDGALQFKRPQNLAIDQQDLLWVAHLGVAHLSVGQAHGSPAGAKARMGTLRQKTVHRRCAGGGGRIMGGRPPKPPTIQNDQHDWARNAHFFSFNFVRTQKAGGESGAERSYRSRL